MPRPSTGRPRGRAQDLGFTNFAPPGSAPGPFIQRTCHHLCCYLTMALTTRADRRCSMAHTTAHESNRECGALDPRALGHVEHSGPETGPFQVSAGSPRPSTGGEFPVVIVPILAPGWAGTRIRGAPRLASGARSTSPAHRLSKPLAARHSEASSSWPTPSPARPTRRYDDTAGGAGLPQPPHAALRRGMQNGVRLPGAATQLHPHCQGKRAQVRLAARAERPGGF